VKFPKEVNIFSAKVVIKDWWAYLNQNIRFEVVVSRNTVALRPFQHRVVGPGSSSIPWRVHSPCQHDRHACAFDEAFPWLSNPT